MISIELRELWQNRYLKKLLNILPQYLKSNLNMQFEND